MRTEFLCISVLRVASGPRVKLASCKSALNSTVVYSTDRSKAVVSVFYGTLGTYGLMNFNDFITSKIYKSSQMWTAAYTPV